MDAANLSQAYGSMTFYVTAIISFVSVGFLLRVLYLRRQHSAMKIVTNTSALVTLAMYVITAFIALSYSRYVFPTFQSLDEQTVFALTYASYFLLWILANQYFLNKIARIPENRRTQFELVKWVLRLEIAVLVFLALATAGVIPVLNLGLFGLDKNTMVELIFVLLSIAALFTFIYFHRSLGREKDNNASKLIKARVQLLQYAIFSQIILSLAIVIGAGLLFANALPVDQIVEFGLFTTVSVISLVTNYIMSASVNIPNSIRVRFNIAPKRFKFVMANTVPNQEA